jgi:Transglycosylase
VAKVGKRLGGHAPRRSGRWLRQNREALKDDQSLGLMVVMAIGLFIVGGVAGFGWAVDRQVRGGVIEQKAEAERRPDWVYLRNMPRYVSDAFVAVAQPSLLDRGNLRTEQDGRSIARELVHQVHLLPNSLSGEAREMVMGPVLEKRMSRPELIELYLNRVYLGQAQGAPVYGIFHASREYFGKLPSDLTLGQAATLAGLMLPPRIEDPKARLGAVGPRRNEVLQVMLAGGLIDEASYRAAVEEPLGFQPGLDQMPFSRPATWGQRTSVIRLPPNLRPVPEDSTDSEA